LLGFTNETKNVQGNKSLEMLSLPGCDYIGLDIMQVVNKTVVEKHSTKGAFNYEVYFLSVCQQ
jgi:hypothetical protein